ncbi:MAG: tRNA (adenosine(37)-N6)-threonylcarbamoyltransferase complex dimerization subunit type 1 TsaB [Acidobacteria bacterium]|nr:tRNA (adenosine(37)-N6)-threonylcarbamoyltransferase complex dimerization subunit type 1 TsaB [Acidobacteriota bacterium]
MNLLALDTCDSRGSVSVLRDDKVLQTVEHDTSDDYSVWLLPAIDRALQASRLTFGDIDVFVAASGPGSFTGVRVGLTTVKAWAEVTGKPIVGVSRLEALATQAAPRSGEFVAAFSNAQRKQIFGALYRSEHDGRLKRIGEEAVIGPEAFLAWVTENTAGAPTRWISTDPEMLAETDAWAARQNAGAAHPVDNSNARIESASPILAPAIGQLGHRFATMKQFTDPLRLDANYVRRSDAEVSWIDRQERASKTAG